MGEKVLFTASTYSHIVNFHLPYLEKFRAEGWTVHVACGGAPMAIPQADEVVHLPLEKAMWSPRNFRAAGMLRERMGREGYALAVAHTSLAAFFTRLAAQGLAERPAVANMVHGYLFDGETGWLKRQVLLGAERWTAGCTDLVLTMNGWDYEAAKRYGLGRKVVRVPGVGVDFTRFDGVPPGQRGALRKKWGVREDAFVLIYAAEFSRRKSQEVIIRALAGLPEGVVLVLAGDGALRDGCRELAGRLGLAGRVGCPGQVGDIPAWYAMADAAVSASRSEGLPFNVMEAMYAGLPVVASDVKGHRDLVEHGTTGLLYPYGDAGACAGQVAALLASAQLRRALAARAREYVARYALDRVLPTVWLHYRSLSPAATAPL